MTADYLLKEVTQYKEVKISESILFEMPEFKIGTDVASMESLALTLNGNQPIKTYNFDISRLESWCKENSLHFYWDHQERIFHIKYS